MLAVSGGQILKKFVPIIVLIVVTSVLAVIFFAIRQGNYRNGAQLVYLSLAATAASILLSEVSVQGLIGLFSPLSATMAGFLWFFCSGPLLKPEMNAYLYYDAEVYLPLASLVIAGMFSFTVGYYSPSPRLDRARVFNRITAMSRKLGLSKNLLRVELALALALFGLLGIVAFLIGANPLSFLTESMYGIETVPQRAVLHPIARYFYNLHRFFLIALAGVSALHLSSRRTPKFGRSFALSLFLLVGWLSAARGARSILLYSVGSGMVIIILRALKSRRDGMELRANWLRILISFIFLMLLGITALQLVNLRASSVPFENRQNGAVSVLDTIIDYGADMNRTLNAVLRVVPERQPFLKGSSYLAVFTLFVPRRLWPGKPESLGSLIASESGFQNENTAFSNIGELYANFGLVGVFLGMFLMGWIFSICWKALVFNRTQPLILLFYSVLPFVAAFLVRGDFTVAAGGALYAWAVLILFLSLVPLSGVKSPSIRYVLVPGRLSPPPT